MSKGVNKPFPDEHENRECWKCDCTWTTAKKCGRIVNKSRRARAKRRWRNEWLNE